MILGYVELYEELCELKGLKKSQLPEWIKIQTGFELTQAAVYEFLDPKRTSVPNAAIAAIFAQAFQVSPGPKYYAAENAYPKGKKGVR